MAIINPKKSWKNAILYEQLQQAADGPAQAPIGHVSAPAGHVSAPALARGGSRQAPSACGVVHVPA